MFMDPHSLAVDLGTFELNWNLRSMLAVFHSGVIFTSSLLLMELKEVELELCPKYTEAPTSRLK